MHVVKIILLNIFEKQKIRLKELVSYQVTQLFTLVLILGSSIERELIKILLLAGLEQAYYVF